MSEVLPKSFKEKIKKPIAKSLVVMSGAAGLLALSGCGKEETQKPSNDPVTYDKYSRSDWRRNEYTKAEWQKDVREDKKACKDSSKKAISQLDKNLIQISYPPKTRFYKGYYDNGREYRIGSCEAEDALEQGLAFVRQVRLTCIGGSLSVRETDYLPTRHRQTRPAEDTFEEHYGSGDDGDGNTTLYDRADLSTSLNSQLLDSHEFCPDGKVDKKEAAGY
jgi:hypothetical protein